MQPLRGTKDILPHEVTYWQRIYDLVSRILRKNNYHEVRTPILENTELFLRTIGDFTDIINKEMYSFNDQGGRNVTLRPEGTASVARSFITNKLYLNKKINRLWYFGPMFRYERPQKGRQRQFHQLGIECIGSTEAIADAEVIRIAIKIIEELRCSKWSLEINAIGNMGERKVYSEALVKYLIQYIDELDNNSRKRLNDNPLRILDSKETRTQEILTRAPKLNEYLGKESLKHFDELCSYLNEMDISFIVNKNLVRGLDYYDLTAFEIKSITNNEENTLCGGGRYNNLIKQIGGPDTPSVGWAIGLERLVIATESTTDIKMNKQQIYLAHFNTRNSNLLWEIIKLIEKYGISFELDISGNNLNKQLKRANQMKCKVCFIIGESEINNSYVTVKWLETGVQQTISTLCVNNYLKYLQYHFRT